MQTQVRIYRIKPGELDRFVEEWRTHVVPLRRRFGFEVMQEVSIPGGGPPIWTMLRQPVG